MQHNQGLRICSSVATESGFLSTRPLYDSLNGTNISDFYGDFVYKLKRIVGSNNFSA